MSISMKWIKRKPTSSSMTILLFRAAFAFQTVLEAAAFVIYKHDGERSSIFGGRSPQRPT